MSFKTSLIIYALYSAPTIIHHNMWNKLQLGFAALLLFIFIFFLSSQQCGRSKTISSSSLLQAQYGIL